MPATLEDNTSITQLLYASEILNKGRSLVHLSHTCNLVINNNKYPVIDSRQLIKGAMVPRGVNEIIVLNHGYRLVNRIEYGNSRPLFCQENKLYLYGDLIVDGHVTGGNVLQFRDYGYEIHVFKEVLNEKLPLTQ